MANDRGKYDSALLAILQNEGKVAPFIDVVLGFLYRRTDFFRIMKTENDRLGFPPGVAHKLLLNIFKQYETLSQQDTVRIEEMKKVQEKKKETTAAASKNVESDMKSSTKNSSEATVEAHPSDTVRGEPEPESQPPTASDTPMAEEPQGNPMETDTDSSLESSKPAEQSTSKPSENADGDEEQEDPEQARMRRELQANPLTYNGAERENYFWSQIITEVDLRVKVPQHVLKGKQMKVDIQKRHIKVSYMEPDNSWCQLVDSDLTWEVNREESMWTLTPGEFVHINLEKREERWWEAVFTEEPKINTRKIDCSRPVTDLDDEAQAKIEEMMFNQRQKQLGLPQSHEQKTHEMLRKAWDAEGSPFKGQPFDPSRFSVDPNGIANVKPS